MHLVSRLFRVRSLGVLARYGYTALIVIGFFLLRLGLPLDGFPFLMFLPAVFIASLIFDRGSGILATILTTLIIVFVFIPPVWDFQFPLRLLPALVVYVLICLAVALVSEAFRKALDRAHDAERRNELLFQELAHRSKNNYQIVSSILHLQARAHTSPEARDALETALTRIRVIAAANDKLHPGNAGAAVGMKEFLETLCGGLGDALRGVRPIAVRVDSESIELPSEIAVPVGFVANELVTNALKYAFPDEAAGSVDVSLKKYGDALVLAVEDDGRGCAEDAVPGVGSKITDFVSRQLRGELQREPRQSGCRCVLTIPAQSLAYPPRKPAAEL